MEEELSMHRLCKTLAVVAALALAVSLSSSLAQAENTPDQYFTTGYFTNAHAPGAPDAQLRLTNDGTTETNLCANIYVFNNDEEMEECCSCAVTPNGYLDLDVNNDLTSNPLGGGPKPSRGILKVVSSVDTGTCSPTTYTPVG